MFFLWKLNHFYFQCFWATDHCFQWFFNVFLVIQPSPSTDFSPMTIPYNGFSMVLGSFNHWFQWFSMVMDHWTNDEMVIIDRSPLPQILRSQGLQGQFNQNISIYPKDVPILKLELNLSTKMSKIWAVRFKYVPLRPNMGR